jgi:ribonuclease BN (tRNA processing enzyme)
MSNSTGSNSGRIIQLFGGQSRLARRLEVPQSTVGHWAQTGSIPAKWQGKLLGLAKSLGLPLQAEDFVHEELPERVGQPADLGALVRRFSREPALPLPPRVENGLFMKELLAASEDRTVFCFVGVGSAFTKLNDQTSLVIAKNRKTILVDLGTTIPLALHRNGIRLTDFDAYHFTHAHADHIGGVEELLLTYRYLLNRRARVIITPAFQATLWEHSLKGGSQINELGLLKLQDLIEPIEPQWLKNQPRETYQLNFEGIHLTIFRTMHTPGDVTQWEKAFWSTGLLVDGQVLFSGDTRFDPTLFTDLDLTHVETIFHDCQLFSPGNVHAPYEALKELPPRLKERMYLTHYGDNFDKYDPPSDGFAGLAKPFVMYSWEQR